MMTEFLDGFFHVLPSVRQLGMIVGVMLATMVFAFVTFGLVAMVVMTIGKVARWWDLR